MLSGIGFGSLARWVLTTGFNPACRVRASASAPSCRFQKVCADLDLSGELTVTYGGSDNNHFFHHGISGLVVASGMNSCHACQEYSSVSELERAARLVEGLILSKE